MYLVYNNLYGQNGYLYNNYNQKPGFQKPGYQFPQQYPQYPILRNSEGNGTESTSLPDTTTTTTTEKVEEDEKVNGKFARLI